MVQDIAANKEDNSIRYILISLATSECVLLHLKMAI